MLTVTAIVLALGGFGLWANSAAYSARINSAYPADGKLVDIDGSDMHVLEQGQEGPIVLMIHGASANAREFSWTLAPRLSDTHRVLMVDRPGHGHSDRAPDAQSLEVQAAQMAGVLKALASKGDCCWPQFWRCCVLAPRA